MHPAHPPLLQLRIAARLGLAFSALLVLMQVSLLVPCLCFALRQFLLLEVKRLHAYLAHGWQLDFLRRNGSLFRQ